jgi:hypothetical protein
MHHKCSLKSPLSHECSLEVTPRLTAYITELQEDVCEACDDLPYPAFKYGADVAGERLGTSQALC